MAGNPNTASERVFRITELARRVAINLTVISQKSPANLACAGPHLVEPVLSVLWAKQQSFCTLLGVLPEAMLDRKELGERKCQVSWPNLSLVSV